ncbi:alkaline phosphatase D family protein [Variovorax sp. HJSM1_2]|uniref:alkaline phosphatase D family protein n=1 Tax=Variovorax sp. HJSM1_2 TaxID=3366263 RepID=UPI003BEE8E01
MPRAGLNRREWLQCVPALASGLWLPTHAQTRPVWQANPFALGVASGAPTASGIVLWTRLLGPLAQDLHDALEVRWEVAHDAQFQQPVQQGRVAAVAALAHSVHVEVNGLAPDRWYHYRFMAGDAVSAVGRCRTLPAPGANVARLRLAYASCQRWEQGYFSAYRHMLAEDLDLVLFLGDYIYETTSQNAVVRGFSQAQPEVLHPAKTLAGYRARYAAYKQDPDLQAMHAACPWLLTWDDHEVQNDYAGLQQGRSGTPVADFAARRSAAYQAYYEHQPLRAAVLTRSLAGLAQGAEMRLYGATAFGRLANLALLDARQYKDPQACNADGATGSSALDPQGCPAWDNPARTLLGVAQEQWLDAHLATQSTGQTTWTVIGQQSLFGARRLRPAPEARWWNDGWDGYAAARSRLTQSLQRSGAANPVLLGGDVHENWVGHVLADYADPRSKRLGVEFCGTSLTSLGGTDVRAQRVLKYNPHFVFAEAERRGYGVAEFTPQQLQVRLRVLDDVARPDAGVSTLAQFAVAAGQPQVLRTGG